MKPITVGLIGIAGAGKDTIATFLKQGMENRGIPTSIYRFATSLKKSAEQIFGRDFDEREVKEVEKWVFITEQSLHNCFGMDRLLVCLKDCLDSKGIANEYSITQQGINAYLSPAKYQQLMGTEILRTIDPNYHVNRFLSQSAELPTFVTLAPDVRFINECEVCDLLVFVYTTKESQRPKHESEKLAQELTIYVDSFGEGEEYLLTVQKLLALNKPIIQIDNDRLPDDTYYINNFADSSIAYVVDKIVRQVAEKFMGRDAVKKLRHAVNYQMSPAQIIELNKLHQTRLGYFPPAKKQVGPFSIKEALTGDTKHYIITDKEEEKPND